MKTTLLKIIRNGLQGNKESMKVYIEMLAVIYEAEGDSKFASVLRQYANEDFGNEVKAI